MELISLKETYPVYVAELNKSDIRLQSTDAIVRYYTDLIEQHPITTMIGIFAHLEHTRNLEEHTIDENIIEAKNVVYCYGKSLVDPIVTGIRPRSFGIVEYEKHFVISFMQAPDPIANQEMIDWTEAISMGQ